MTFKPGKWQTEINVRDFIVNNYTINFALGAPQSESGDENTSNTTMDMLEFEFTSTGLSIANKFDIAGYEFTGWTSSTGKNIAKADIIIWKNN